jgi:DNA-directed RNA polymerase specialized sigma24 family protein
MTELTFEYSHSVSRRIAGVHAARISSRYRLPADFHRDLEQEGLLELWLKRSAYDVRRGNWPTFSERVVANKLSSLVRRMHSKRSGQFREEPLKNFLHLPSQNDQCELRAEVAEVLSRVSPFDRAVARCLIDNSAIETSGELSVTRAAIYRAIGRLRITFTGAGFSNGNRYANRERSPVRRRGQTVGIAENCSFGPGVRP